MPASKGGSSAVMAEETTEEVVITRLFDARREVVFDAWTDPQQLAKWFGPHHFTIPRCEVDARAGGTFNIDMRGPDGTVYPNRGFVRELVRPERFAFSLAVEDERGNAI